MADLLPASRVGAGSVQIVALPSASAAATRFAPSQATEVTGCGAGTLAASACEATFHTSTLPSEVPAATMLPSGPNDTAFVQFAAPLRVPSATAVTDVAAGFAAFLALPVVAVPVALAPGLAPDLAPDLAGATFHSHTFASWLVAASSPPLENATPLTMLAGPDSVPARLGLPG